MKKSVWIVGVCVLGLSLLFGLRLLTDTSPEREAERAPVENAVTSGEAVATSVEKTEQIPENLKGIALARLASNAREEETHQATKGNASKELQDASITIDGDGVFPEKVGQSRKSARALKYPLLSKKLESRLLDAWLEASSDGVESVIQTLKNEKVIFAENGQDIVALVFMDGTMSAKATESQLRVNGATVVRSGADNIKIAVPIDRLSDIASQPGVTRVRTVTPPRLKNTTMTEGLSVTLASAWQTAGFQGQNVKVAVVDSGFANLATLKSQDEIPSSAVEKNFTANPMTSGSSSHGSACAEIIYDMAPSVQMHLIKIDDPADFELAKDYCIANGIDIVSCSLGYDALNFHDGIAYANPETTVASHPVTAVNAATSSGILWVMAAGNEQKQQTLIDWRDGGTPDSFLDWNSSQGDLNLLYSGGSSTIPAGTDLYIFLTWDHWPLSSSDFDLRLYRNTGSGWSVVAAGEDVQDGSGTSYPYEDIGYQTTMSGQYAVAVCKFGSVTDATFILRYYGVSEPTYFGYDNLYNPVPGSISIPGDAASAFTVGALNHETYTSGSIEYFSSLGPNNRAYTGGSAVVKPDICGPNRTASVTYGGGFGGTSAATPHVAGLAALVKGVFPSYTVAQIKAYIEANGFDLGTAGKDSTYGSGAARLANRPPTDVGLSSSTVAENESVGTAVGTLSTTDPDSGDTFIYTLVSGSGFENGGGIRL